MKRFLCSLLLLVVLLPLTAAVSKVGKKMYVAVDTVAVKDSSGFFAKEMGTAHYGDIVVVLKEKEKWLEVKLTSSEIQGWIPSAALTSKKILQTSGRRASASAKELSLAGKGFSQEVENSYKELKQVDYEIIDQLEKITVDQDALYQFLIEGELNTGEENE